MVRKFERSQDLTVNVAASDTEVLRPNLDRTYCLLINDSDTVIYLALGFAGTLNRGIRLNASGGSYEIIESLNPYHGPIRAIHGGVGNKVLLVTEQAAYSR